MNRSVRRRLGVLIFGFVLIAAACGDDDDRAVTTVVPTTAATTTQAPPEPIVIGVVAGLTGRGASFSVPWEMGLQLAIQVFEDLGGIDGRPVTVIIEDFRVPARGCAGCCHETRDRRQRGCPLARRPQLRDRCGRRVRCR